MSTHETVRTVFPGQTTPSLCEKKNLPAESAYSSQSKPTNPKDQVAVHKLPLHLVPASLRVYATLGFVEGAAKYGAYNWRVAGVRASVYYDALNRHMEKWWSGEWADPLTKIPHLANAVSCLGIIIDAYEMGKLTDDRPPSNVGLIHRMADFEHEVKRIREVFNGCNPKHWTELNKNDNSQSS